MSTMDIIKLLASIVSAFAVGLYSIPIVIKIAVKKDLVAKPNHRTSHTGRIPNVGGVSIFVAFVLSFLFSANIEVFPSFQYFLFALIALFFVGLYDDIMIISAKKKLLGEIVGILGMVILGDIRLSNLHGFFGIEQIPYMVSILLTLFVIVVIINALNLIDGIDGLASGIGMVIALFFGIYFILAGGDKNFQLAILSFCLFSSLIPFFLFNVFANRNKIFMGDAGALILGFIIAVLVVEFCETNISAGAYRINNAPVMALCVLVIPLFDTIRVFTIRLSQRKSPFTPDKNHLHHILLNTGLNHRKSTAVLASVNIAYILFGLACQDMQPYLFFMLVFVSCVIWTEALRYRANKIKDSLMSKKTVTAEIYNIEN
ncbi:MAG: undecaprenyl/decaprenyl-phosphate alpha-N-acetylglucosaminyl 1-phosphate transferase [Prevotellaceae bacterium]|nr:undecaprenyl/decaprenyl-phosphate alpha-N-acetylglucosaminyl 1-phosphate transferase [Prevotellaceae bacterium]